MALEGICVWLLVHPRLARPGLSHVRENRRTGDDSLSKERHIAKRRTQFGTELRLCQLPHVKRIRKRASSRIHIDVRRADNQKPIRAQDSPHLCYEGLM